MTYEMLNLNVGNKSIVIYDFNHVSSWGETSVNNYTFVTLSCNLNEEVLIILYIVFNFVY